MKKFILAVLIIMLVPAFGFCGMLVQKAVAGSETVTVGATTCGPSACDYSGSDGTYINPNLGDTKYDTAETIRVEGDAGQGLIYLDTSNLPGSKTITDVKLYIYPTSIDNSPELTINIYKMLTSPGGATWTESDVTYNERIDSTNIQWGGDTQASPLAGTDFDESGGPLVTKLGSVFSVSSWGYFSSSALTTLVGGWYNATTSNYGVLLLAGTIGSPLNFSNIIFSSEDSATASQRFYWSITYE